MESAVVTEDRVAEVVDEIWDLVEKHRGEQGLIYRELAQRIVKAEQPAPPAA